MKIKGGKSTGKKRKVRKWEIVINYKRYLNWKKKLLQFWLDLWYLSKHDIIFTTLSLHINFRFIEMLGWVNFKIEEFTREKNR